MPKTTKFTNLQVLRFFAAMSVVLYHTYGHYMVYGGADNFGIIKYVGFAGVDVFFVLSGFIMWWTCSELRGVQNALRFLYNRYSRIYIGYLPWTIVAAVIAVVIIPFRWPTISVWKSVTLWPLANFNELLIPPAWTLSYELAFYTSLSLVILLGRSFATHFLVAVVACVVVSIFVSSYSTQWPNFLFSPLVMEFLGGIAVAYLVRRGALRRPALWLLAGLGATAAIGAFCAVSGFDLSAGPRTLLRVLLFGPCAMAIVGGVAGTEGQIRPWRGLVLLGDASYALYLCHNPILLLWRGASMRGWVHNPSPLVSATLAVAAMLGVSVLFYLYFERPMLRTIQRKRLPMPAIELPSASGSTQRFSPLAETEGRA